MYRYRNCGTHIWLSWHASKRNHRNSQQIKQIKTVADDGLAPVVSFFLLSCGADISSNDQAVYCESFCNDISSGWHPFLINYRSPRRFPTAALVSQHIYKANIFSLN